MRRYRQVVLFVTHFINNYVVEGFQRMRTELEDKEFDVLMLLNSEETSDIERISALRLPFYLTDINKINSLRYTPILNTLFPGSCHFPVLAFFQEHPEYSHYWFVEYDVCFTGDWALLADDCTDNLSDYDFLSCHVEMFTDSNRAIGKDLHHIKFLSDSLVSVTISKSKFCDNECEFNYYDSFLPFKESLQYRHGCEGIVAIDSDMPLPKFITVRFQNKILSSIIDCPADTCIISGIGLKKHSDPDSDPFYLDSAQIQSFISENANRHVLGL